MMQGSLGLSSWAFICWLWTWLMSLSRSLDNLAPFLIDMLASPTRVCFHGVEPFRDQPYNPPAARLASITVEITRKPCPVNPGRPPDPRTRNVT